jgi:hypothetical protein
MVDIGDLPNLRSQFVTSSFDIVTFAHNPKHASHRSGGNRASANESSLAVSKQ